MEEREKQTDSRYRYTWTQNIFLLVTDSMRASGEGVIEQKKMINFF